MKASKASAKEEIRDRMLATRHLMPLAVKREYDEAINKRLAELPALAKAPLIATYLSDGTEPNLGRFLKSSLEAGRRICAPRSIRGGGYAFAEVKSLTKGLVEGRYALIEPGPDAPETSVEDLKKAVWLVPGVAFDMAGGRLGRGKGIYDRLLAGGCGLSIGIFYEFQKCESLPLERHDLRLDAIVTEREVRDVSSKMKGDRL